MAISPTIWEAEEEQGQQQLFANNKKVNWYKIASNIVIAGHYQGWANAYWIAPNGEVFDTDGLTHQGWIGENYDLLQYYDINLEEQITDLVSIESREYVDEEIKRLEKKKQELEDEGETEGWLWNDTISQLEYYSREDAVYEVENNTRDDFALSRWATYVVNELMKRGWVRVLYKHGIYHVEIEDFDNDKAIKAMPDYLFDLNLDSDQTVQFEIGSFATQFKWGEFLASGEPLADYLGHDRQWKMVHWR